MSVWFSESGPCALFEKGMGHSDVVNYKAGMVRGASQYVHCVCVCSSVCADTCKCVSDGKGGPSEPAHAPTASGLRVLA